MQPLPIKLLDSRLDLTRATTERQLDTGGSQRHPITLDLVELRISDTGEDGIVIHADYHHPSIGRKISPVDRLHTAIRAEHLKRLEQVDFS